MKIIIPMAGSGKRVAEFGVPKPLIELENGLTIIESALRTLNIDAHYCFVTRRYHENLEWNKQLNELLIQNTDAGGCTIVELDYLPNGPAMSAAHAPHGFFDDDKLIVTNCDQIMNWDSAGFVNFVHDTDAAGVVVTYVTNTPKNSYALVIKDGTMTPEFLYVREKEVISEFSLNGIHYFESGNLFLYLLEQMKLDPRSVVNGEYYIGPMYNYLGREKRVYHIDRKAHWPVGTVEDIEHYNDFGPVLLT